jgi:hypothetical protein
LATVSAGMHPHPRWQFWILIGFTLSSRDAGIAP